MHLVEDPVRHDPAALVATVEEHGIDFLDVTPTVLKQLMSAGLFTEGRHHPGTLMVGGEALDPALWERLRRLPRTAVHNYYGPTECTVDAVWCRLDQQGEAPVIGRPGQHVRAYVLDRCLRPVPPAVTGELYLGGAQVARGYLGAARS